MKLSLIISAYNQHVELDKVLRGVSLQNVPPDEVLIADDGSTAASREVIDRWRSESRFPLLHLWHPDNGFRKLTILNKSIAAATGDYLVFIDGDCVPHRRFIADHRALAEGGFWVQGRRCFIREPFVSGFEAGKTSVWRWWLRGRIARGYQAFRMPLPLVLRDRSDRGIRGCNMAFWREDVVAVNGFDERYQGRGIGPDYDLGCRIYNLGRSRKYIFGHALVFHLDHPAMPRPYLAENNARVREVIRAGGIRSEQGLDQHVNKSPPADALPKELD
jgi:glycosyltransferase involved in cell wall biosynthesis